MNLWNEYTFWIIIVGAALLGLTAGIIGTFAVLRKENSTQSWQLSYLLSSASVWFYLPISKALTTPLKQVLQSLSSARPPL